MERSIGKKFLNTKKILVPLVIFWNSTDGRVISRKMLKGGAYVEGVAEDVSPIRSFEELEDLRRERAKDW